VSPRRKSSMKLARPCDTGRSGRPVRVEGPPAANSLCGGARQATCRLCGKKFRLIFSRSFIRGLTRVLEGESRAGGNQISGWGFAALGLGPELTFRVRRRGPGRGFGPPSTRRATMSTSAAVRHRFSKLFEGGREPEKGCRRRVSGGPLPWFLSREGELGDGRRLAGPVHAER